MFLEICSKGGIINEKNIENSMPKEAKIKTCFKGCSFDVINKLMDEKYLYFSRYKNKSVSLTPKGEELAKRLIEKYIK